MWQFWTELRFHLAQDFSGGESLVLVVLAIMTTITAAYLFIREVGVLWENLIDLTPIFLVASALALLLIAIASL